MTQPFVVSMKLVGEGRGAVQAVQEVRREIEATQRAVISMASGRNAANIDQMLGIGQGRSTAQARADIEAYGASLDKLRAQFVPLFSLEQQHKANLDAIAGAQRVGAISAEEAAAAIDRETAAHHRAIAALDGHTHATNMQTGALARANAQRANLIFQLQDILVSLGSGQSLGIVALQQGSQISTIYGPGEGGLGKALSETGRLAVGLAAKFWPILAAVGMVSAGIAGMRHEIEKSSGVAVSFGDVFLATLQVIGGYIHGLFRPAIEAIGHWFGSMWGLVVEQTKLAFNRLIGGVHLFIEQVRMAWEIVPSLFELAGKESAKAFVSAIEWLVQKALEGIDGLIEGLNSFIDTFGGDALRDALGWEVNIPTLVDKNKPFSLGIDIDTTGAAKKVADTFRAYQETAASIFTRDYAGEFFGDVQAQAIKNYNDRLEDTEKKAKKAADGLAWTKEGATKLKEALDFGRDTLRGFVTDLAGGLRQGMSAWDAFATAASNALNRIADRALGMAADGIFDLILGAMFPGAGGVGRGAFGRATYGTWTQGFFPAFPGYADGGWTGGQRGQVAGVVHGEEFVVKAGPAARYRSALEDLNSGRPLAANSNTTYAPTTYIDARGSQLTAAQFEAILDRRDRANAEKTPAIMANARRRGNRAAG